MSSTRRTFVNSAAAVGALLGARRLLQAQQTPPAMRPPGGLPMDSWVGQPQPYPYYQGRSVVSLVKGESRRKNITDALLAIDDQIQPGLKTKKHVIITPNACNTRQVGTTHAETLMGILDYLAPRFKGPIIIAESSMFIVAQCYEALGYQKVVDEFKSRDVSLIDLNEEAKYEVIPVFDYNIRVLPIRLAKRLLDPDAYIIGAAIPKPHDVQVVTAAVKNMVLGTPLVSAPKEKPAWSDKRKFHVGVRMMNVNMMITAQKLKPFWGATVIDGYEAVEGKGIPVPHRIAMASTDYLAADRVCVEAMGVDPSWIGHLVACSQAGLGQYDLDKIDIRGEKVANVRRTYQLHPDLEIQKRWMGPMEELPPRLTFG